MDKVCVRAYSLGGNGFESYNGLFISLNIFIYYPWPVLYLTFITYNSQILFCNPSFSSAVGFCFIFASFLMLLTTICFLIGAPAQTVCKSVQTGEIYSKVCEMRMS